MAKIYSPKTVTSPANKVPALWGSARLTYTICAFLAMLLHLCMRNILNFIILCMVQTEKAENFVKYNDSCPLDTVNKSSAAKAGDLLWTRSQEFIVTGSFYYGFIVIQPIAGRLADKFGGKLLFVHSLTIQALVFMLIPFFARKSYMAAVAVRSVQGLVAAFGSPALYQLFSIWAHPSERTVFLTFAYTGFSAGSVLVFPISSYFCKYGWELVFYAVGGVALLFGVCCHWLVYSTLEDHPRLSREEYEYLKVKQVETPTTKVPWKLILTSLPMHAFIFTHFFHSYGEFAFTLLIPRYFKEALHLPLDTVGLLSSAPYLGVFMSKALCITTCNIIEKQQNLNLTVLRRISYVVCNCVTIMLIFGMILSSCRDRLTVILFAIFIGFASDIGFSGIYWPSLLYLAPTLAGLISGLANCFATINGFLVPLAISHLVRHGSKDEWNLLLISLMCSFLISAIIYGVFGSSMLGKWNEIDNNNHKYEDTTKETYNKNINV